MAPQHGWVVESKSSEPDDPHYLVGRSGGGCFFIWSQDHTRAMKFNTEKEALDWVKETKSISLLCEAYVTKFSWG